MQVEMLVVGDDCALPHSALTGRRGIAGSLLTFKIAGAAAAASQDLAAVTARTAEAAARIGSMGVATRACTLPGAQLADPPR
jgi:dihydroxyacetone kinase